MKTTSYLNSLLIVALLATSAAAATSTRQYKKSSNLVVRDHRSSAQAVAGQSAGTTPSNNVQPAGPIVRDHRDLTPIVRDHRGEGVVVRDHRGTTPVLPPPPQPVKQPPFPGGVKPPVGPIGPIGPIGPVKDPPAPPSPPQNPPQPPKNPCPKPSFPWWQLGGFFPGGYYPVGGYSSVVVQEPVVITVATGSPATDEATLPTLMPDMEVTLTGAEFGSQAGQAVVRIGDLAIPAQVVKWQADAVTLRLPTLGVAKPTPAQLVVVRADGTSARELPFEFGTLAAN